MLLARRLRPLVAVALGIAAMSPMIARAGAPTGDDLLGCGTPGQVARIGGLTKIKAPPHGIRGGTHTLTSFPPSPTPEPVFASHRTLRTAAPPPGRKLGQ